MDFVILKVNGEDLRNATHDQAIQAFRQAKEPIIVEVARRGPSTDNATPIRDPACADLPLHPSNEERLSQHSKTLSTGVQTDITAEEATLAAMAAAALTTEDIRAALSLRHSGVPSSETVFSSSMSGLLDIVELDAEEDEDEVEEDEDEDLEDEDEEDVGIIQLDSSNGVDENDTNDNCEQHLLNAKDNLVPKDGFGGNLLANGKATNIISSKCKSINTTGLSSAIDCSQLDQYNRQNCVCQEAVNEQYDRHEYHKLMAHYQTRVAPHQEQPARSPTYWTSLPLEHIQFTEIKLVRNTPAEKFGLTLCYRNTEGDPENCDVYVGEIEPDSVASRCGDILLGDRIIKINGELIKSRFHVIDLFGQSNDVATLLIARQHPLNPRTETIDPGSTSFSGVFQPNPHHPSHPTVHSPVAMYPLMRSIRKTQNEFNELNRPDQDSGIGRTTDESARTEESSEQEVELDHTSRLTCNSSTDKNTMGWPLLHPLQSGIQSSAADLSQSYLTSPNPPCDVFANYNPVDPIDQELVQLGRLMQSLAVHCRQLVQTKFAYRSPCGADTPTEAPPRTVETNDTSVGHLPKSNTVPVSSTNTASSSSSANSSASSSNARQSGESAQVTPRVPRMGTRMEPGVITYSGLTDFPLPSVNRTKANTRTHAEQNQVSSSEMQKQNDKESFNLDPNSKKNFLSNDLTQSGCFDKLPESYPGPEERRHTPSGQTSAYCTGESIRSHPETVGVGIRLWQPTEHITSSSVDGNSNNPERTGDSSGWTGPVAASLSDLDGSLLSLAATVPSVQNFFPTTSESIASSSHILAESLSPLSNWSIDGSSQSNQRCIGQTTRPHPNNNTTTVSGLRHLSADGSRDRLGSGGLPPQSESPKRPVREGGVGGSSGQTLSSADSLSANQAVSALTGSEGKLPSSLEDHSPFRNDHHQHYHHRHLHRRRPASNEPRSRQKVEYSSENPVDSAENSNEKLNRNVDLKSHPDPELLSNLTEQICTQNSTPPYLPLVQTGTNGNAATASGTSNSSPHSGQDSSTAQQCFCLPYMSPHRQHKNINAKPSATGVRPTCASRRTGYLPAGLPPHPPPPLAAPVAPALPPPPPPTIPPPPPDQCIHPYEFYDHFCSKTSVLGQPVWSHLRSMPTKIGSQLSNQPKNNSTEENLLSDIYETPYASVTVNEEPTAKNGDSNPPRTTDPSNPRGSETTGRNKPGVPNQRYDYTQLQQTDWLLENSRFYSSFGPNASGAAGVALSPVPGPHCPAPYTSLLHAFERFDLGYHYSQMPLYTSAQHTHPQMHIPGPQDEPTAATNVMEWVVKKRPDGSRYITRRPIRNRLLKERARRVAEERSGLTTDDDAVSELKVGRYWNRTERRKQLEKARADRKKRQTTVVAATTSCSRPPNEAPKNAPPSHPAQSADLITMTTV